MLTLRVIDVTLRLCAAIRRFDMTFSESSEDKRYLDVLHDLEAQYGPMVSGPPLRRLLGFRTGTAFRQADRRGALPLKLFSIPERRGKFAWVRDVAAWLVMLERGGQR